MPTPPRSGWKVAAQAARDLLTGLVAIGLVILIGAFFAWVGYRFGDLIAAAPAVQISVALVPLVLAWPLGYALNRGLFGIAWSKVRNLLMSSVFRSVLNRTEIVIRVSMQKVKADRYELAGSFLTIPLDVVMETLSAAWKTGLLSVDCAGQYARVYFENGNVVAVRCNGLEDKEAFNALYREAKGHFLFHAGRIPPQRTMHSPVVPLLREAKRETGESAETTAHRTIRPTSFKH